MGAIRDIELAYEKRNVNNIVRTQNEMLKIFRLSIEDLTKQIHILQSKRLTTPERYGKQLKRNKRLKVALSKYQKDLAAQLEENMQGKLEYSWGLANKKNNALVRTYVGGLKTEFARPNLEALEQFINRKVGGLPLSDRLWNLSNSSRKLMEDWLGTGITQGKSAKRITKEAIQMMNNPKGAFVTNEAGERIKFSKVSDYLRQPPAPGQYKNPKDAILRVARNETNFAYRTSDHIRMQQLDFIVGKEVHLSNAHADFDVCDNLQGKYPKTFIFSGWHISCLCYVTTILKTKKEFREGGPSSREVKRIPIMAERLVKTIHAGKVEVNGAKSFQMMPWFKENFSNGTPISKVGGARKGLKSYKTKKDLTYAADPKRYLTKAKKVG